MSVWIESDLKWNNNTCSIIKKGRKRLYFLKVLKKYAARAKDLLSFYCSLIQSVLEYGDILWHGGLTLLQSHDIERIQKRALRIIVPHLKYEEALTTFKLTSSKERREKHCVKLIKQMLDMSHKLNYLLPEKVRDVWHRGTRYDGNKFYNVRCRTEHFKNSPLVFAIDKYNSSF